MRADGSPISLPVWFAVVGRTIYITTRGKKLQRIRSNPVSNFLVESGLRWAELKAVQFSGHATIVEPDATFAQELKDEMGRKYSSFRTATSDMSKATRDHYAAGSQSVDVGGRVSGFGQHRLGVARLAGVPAGRPTHKKYCTHHHLVLLGRSSHDGCQRALG